MARLAPCYRVGVPIELTVVHPSLSFVRGLSASFDSAEYLLVRPDDRQGEPRGVVLFAVAEEAGWERLERLCANPDATVVALIPTLEVPSYARALSAGAAGVAHVDADPETIRVVTEAALAAEVVLPAEAARAMARHLTGREKASSSLDGSELEMLQKLSDGATVVALADSLFLAERTVRRKLQGIYLKLGVGGRAEALKRAAQLGLLD